MVRLAVFDVDGTVLEKGEAKVSEASLSTIEKIASMGIGVMFASGRSFYELKELFSKLSFEAVYAASDGSLCIAGDETLVDMPISKNDVLCVFNYLKSFNCVGIEFCTKYLSYVFGREKFVSTLRRDRKNQIKTISSFADIEDDVYKITVYGLDESAFVKAGLKNSLGKNLRIAYESGGIAEIVRSEANKQLAVLSVRKRFMADGGKVMAVGDGENDLPMLLGAELSVAMEHSDKHIKNICTARVKNICEVEKILINSVLEEML